MKRITSHFKPLALLLVGMIVLLGSCTHEEDISAPESGKGETTFTLELPNAMVVQTRSGVATPAENTIKTLYMLICEPSNGKLLNIVTCTNLKAVDNTNSKEWTFKAKLTKDKTYDLLLVANAQSKVEALKAQLDQASGDITRQDITNAFEIAKTTQWTVDGSTEANSIPMWGQLLNQQITAMYSPSAKFKLTRMLARINVAVAQGVSNFELTSVHYYNYNTKGNVHTGVSTAVATGQSFLYQNPADASAPFEDNACLNRIYVFEANHVAAYGKANWTNNPCIVIGGKYDGGDETFYRLDFITKDEDDKDSWLNIQRNHSYTFTINSVSGDGYGLNDAYNSAPINMEAEVNEWNDDNDINGGVWNGSQSILFSGRTAHFTHVGSPVQHELTILTNMSDITFGGFENNVVGTKSGEDNWTNTWAKTGSWTNGHFTVEITSKAAAREGYTQYTLIITAEAAVSGDNEKRETTFVAKGSILQTDFTITQNPYQQFSLITSPNPLNAIMISGDAQRYPIEVESTHPYSVTIVHDPDGDGGMFGDVYTAETGGTKLDKANIAANIKKIWVEITTYAGFRLGSLSIDHTTEGQVTPVSYNVIQVAAMFRAAATTDTEIGASGTVTINVESNISGWYPMVTSQEMDGTTIKEYTKAESAAFFNKASGSNTADVIFTAPADKVEKPYNFIVVFKSEGYDDTAPITIALNIHHSTHGGWAGSNIYWDGTKLTFYDNPSYDTSVTSENQRIGGVHFKWGSLIGLGVSKTVWDTPAEDRYLYVPEEYTLYGSKPGEWFEYKTIVSGAPWTNIVHYDKMMNGNNATTRHHLLEIHEPSKGIGDICRYISERGDAPGGPEVKWRMPTQAEFGDRKKYIKNEDNDKNEVSNITVTADGNYVLEKNYHTYSYQLSYSVLFPCGGFRPEFGNTWSATDGNANGGNPANWGGYWSGTGDRNATKAGLLRMYRASTTTGDYSYLSKQPRGVAATVRCVRDVD